jgi:WhiB family redox-sensing transcriptional regulator
MLKKDTGWQGSESRDSELWGLVLSNGMCGRSGIDPDRWYPDSVRAAAARREAADAIRVCAGCVVRRQCLELSLRYWTVGQHGIWGGTVPAERQELRRQLVRRANSSLEDRVVS